ncbi:MAG: sugar transferase [Flavipsychrobacter sp.]|nr:sugar transferase [Flavipsychrobacter sp.]
MEQPVYINIPVERKIKPISPDAPQSDIAEIREMFREMNQRYMVYQPAPYYHTVKRAIDIVASATFIFLVMSWLFPIVALLIKLSSKGPVFFRQKRTGLKGVEFDCFKFRTMYVNDEADTKQATYKDKRITRVGRFLRATHLDETAQFFNVLLGDMSIVGPRPHMLYHTRYYAQSIPYYNLRHESQPGMTGMAQIKGYIGEINVERELRKRVQWDVYYLKNRSISLDIKIILTTFGQVFVKAFHSIIGKKSS